MNFGCYRMHTAEAQDAYGKRVHAPRTRVQAQRGTVHVGPSAVEEAFRG